MLDTFEIQGARHTAQSTIDRLEAFLRLPFINPDQAVEIERQFERIDAVMNDLAAQHGLVLAKTAKGRVEGRIDDLDEEN